MPVCDSFNLGGSGTGFGALGAFNITKNGQSFTGDGNVLSTAKFDLSIAAGAPTGNAVCEIFAHTGAFGAGGTGTGSVLATSGTFDVTTLTGSAATITFTFTGANKITLSNGTNYVVVVTYAGANDASNYIRLTARNSAPTHAGNLCYHDGTWQTLSTWDANFEVNTDVAGITPKGPNVYPQILVQ